MKTLHLFLSHSAAIANNENVRILYNSEMTLVEVKEWYFERQRMRKERDKIEKHTLKFVISYKADAREYHAVYVTIGNNATRYISVHFKHSIYNCS